MSTVLIVDDSKTSRYMLRHILVENGSEIKASPIRAVSMQSLPSDKGPERPE